MAGVGRSLRVDEPSLQSGVGTAIGHHGELLQGVFEDRNGQLHRGLVTLPLARLTSKATFTLTGTSTITAHPDDKTKAGLAARLTLDRLDIAEGGVLRIESGIPVGHGYGSSTADVVAAIRAVAAAHNAKLRPSRIGQLAVAAEQASDAIAFDENAVLFAQREGVVLEHFGGSLPPLLLVGFKASGGRPIDTLKLPPARYDSTEIQQFRVLRALISRAVRYQDPDCLGRAATVSARISQRHLPKRHFDRVIEIAEDAGACGVQVAHSGSLLGILFDRAGKDLRHRAGRAAASAQRSGFCDVEIHQINEDGARW
ncbi:kinase [Mesorhizobium australicum]|uniref:Threonine kinase n=1 Tax=Mesorhizobium australicum TaxID=536018 RepID=A0A1X7NR99_9HYPH|nr:kinase [Mesorhizobium australicum]SMH40549.1 threonine kinase [Mesorhizobium australicum]